METSLSLGATAAARTWMFADNRSRAAATQQLVITAPGDTDATARVSIVADVDTIIEQRVVQVPATSAAFDGRVAFASLDVMPVVCDELTTFQ